MHYLVIPAFCFTYRPCLTRWHIWLCHMEVGRTLVLNPSIITFHDYYIS
jgi:hypothetical protein